MVSCEEYKGRTFPVGPAGDELEVGVELSPPVVVPVLVETPPQYLVRGFLYVPQNCHESLVVSSDKRK